MKANREPIKVGVAGTGYVARHFVQAWGHHEDLTITRVLTRRDPNSCARFPRPDLLTNALDELIDHCDVVFESTGDPVYTTDIADAACRAGRPVVTINAEFHVTSGSYFADKGLVTESAGDQPGSLADLRERALTMGFRPVVYGNMKAFLNRNPTLKEMRYWGDRNDLSLRKVTSFTDGTKLQVEQALVANGCGATIARPGLLGPEMADVAAAGRYLAEVAHKINQPISDYILFRSAPHGVFIVCEHDDHQHEFLRHMKMGEGPYYVLQRDDVLVHLEVPRILRRTVYEGRGLLDNSPLPTITVATVAKRHLPVGTFIDKGIGSFDVRGEAVRIEDAPGVLPIGLADRVRLTRAVEPGQYLSFDDVELPDTLALKAWQETEMRSLNSTAQSHRNGHTPSFPAKPSSASPK